MRKLHETAKNLAGPVLSAGTGIVALAIAYLSLVPQEEVPTTGLGDHAHHFIAYGTLAVLAALSIRTLPRWALAAVMVAYGILLEILQGLMPFGRHASITDGVANTLGIGLGLLLAGLILKVASRPRQS